MPVEFEPRGRARSCRDAPRGSSRLLARHGVRARVHRVPGGGPRRARLSRRRVSRLRLKSPEKSGKFITPPHTWFGPAVRRQRSSISDCMSSLRSLLWRANWKGNPRNPSRAHTARRRSDVHQTTSIRALAQTRIDPYRPSPRPNEPGARERRAAATAHTAVRVRRKGALIFQRDDRWRHHLD